MKLLDEIDGLSDSNAMLFASLSRLIVSTHSGCPAQELPKQDRVLLLSGPPPLPSLHFSSPLSQPYLILGQRNPTSMTDRRTWT